MKLINKREKDKMSDLMFVVKARDRPSSVRPQSVHFVTKPLQFGHDGARMNYLRTIFRTLKITKKKDSANIIRVLKTVCRQKP
jgi:hypothetical protein